MADLFDWRSEMDADEISISSRQDHEDEEAGNTFKMCLNKVLKLNDKTLKHH